MIANLQAHKAIHFHTCIYACVRLPLEQLAKEKSFDKKKGEPKQVKEIVNLSRKSLSLNYELDGCNNNKSF